MFELEADGLILKKTSAENSDYYYLNEILLSDLSMKSPTVTNNERQNETPVIHNSDLNGFITEVSSFIDAETSTPSINYEKRDNKYSLKGDNKSNTNLLETIDQFISRRITEEILPFTSSLEDLLKSYDAIQE